MIHSRPVRLRQISPRFFLYSSNVRVLVLEFDFWDICWLCPVSTIGGALNDRDPLAIAAKMKWPQLISRIQPGILMSMLMSMPWALNRSWVEGSRDFLLGEEVSEQEVDPWEASEEDAMLPVKVKCWPWLISCPYGQTPAGTGQLALHRPWHHFHPGRFARERVVVFAVVLRAADARAQECLLHQVPIPLVDGVDRTQTFGSLLLLIVLNVIREMIRLISPTKCSQSSWLAPPVRWFAAANPVFSPHPPFVLLAPFN